MVVDIRRLTVEEYHRMGELGIVDPDEHVELIEGQIIKKPVKGTPHSAATKGIEKLLENLLGEQVLVRLQDPVRLDDYSEPEPDVAVVMPDPLYYEDHHPTSSEVLRSNLVGKGKGEYLMNLWVKFSPCPPYEICDRSNLISWLTFIDKIEPMR